MKLAALTEVVQGRKPGEYAYFSHGTPDSE